MLILALIVVGCSQKKNTLLNRSFHNINSKWNGLFNAKEAYKEGLEKLEDGHKDNYRKLLPIYIYPDNEMAQSLNGNMETVIKKCSRVIEYHSMDIKGKEYCKWIDDSWLLIGQAYFYQRNYDEAIPVFKYISKKYRKTSTKHDARLWLIRTYIEKEDHDLADQVIRIMENSKDIPEEMLPEFKATKAHYFISLEEYDKAIIEMEEAVLFQKKKKILTRWLFVLAQLYAIQGETIRANDTYKQVVKKHPKYEMEFWAQMNRALAYSSADGSSYDIKRVLLKMLRDDKNLEYRDKLFYALSEVYEAEGEEDKRINALELSTKSSVDDNYQKGLSFLTLAEIYFNRPEYRPAQANYDSTVQYLPEDYPNLEEIVNIQQSLKELVDKIIIIETEDSLQALARLPQHELDAMIDDIIEEKIAEEERRREEEAGGGANASSDDFGMNTDLGGNSGKWYFYNTKSVEYGKSEFKKVWGGRPNEDNWRRSDKSSTSMDDFEADGGFTVDSTLTKISDRSQYLKDIPFTEQALSASNQKVEQAMYDLGIIYKEKMDDHKKAVGPWRKLVVRFDSSKNRTTALYQLYRTYFGLGNNDSADYFKNYILYRYPNSDYAKIIKDPDYAKNKSDVDKWVAQAYRKALSYYDAGYYSACINKCDEVLKDYPDNKLKIKFLYLKALCAGEKKSKPELVASLKKFAGEHSDSPEAKDALKRIQVLTTKKKVVKKEPPPKYSYDPNARHLAVMIVPQEGNDIEEVKKSISNYHKAYHATKNYSVSSVILDKENFMVSIKQFKNEGDADDYYSGFKRNRSVLKKINEKDFGFFIISYNNYAMFFQDKRTDVYIEFMKKHYEL